MNVSRVISASLVVAVFAASGTNIASAKSIFTKSSEVDVPSTSNNLASLVDREARANGVPVALARAVVRIESNWNTRLTGRAGEVGLMQI